MLAPLLLLRFADRRSLPQLKRSFDNDKLPVSAPLLRASAVVYSSYGDAEFKLVRRSASRLMLNHLADVVRLLERIRKYDDVPVRYKARLSLRFDPVAGTRFVDMRSLLMVKLLRSARAPKVLRWVSDWKNDALSKPISDYDRRLISRLL
jgi:hypothetical protein